MTRDGISSDMPTPDPDYDAHGPSLIERLQLRNYQVTNLTFVLNLTHQCANISRKRCRPSQGLELHTDPSIRASTLPYPHSSSQQPPWISLRPHHRTSIHPWRSSHDTHSIDLQCHTIRRRRACDTESHTPDGISRDLQGIQQLRMGCPARWHLGQCQKTRRERV